MLGPDRGASFFVHIARIIFLRAEKQVRRVHTLTIIALVQNAQTGGYWAVVDLPRDPVREPRPFFNCQNSVTVAAQRTSPAPALHTDDRSAV